MSDVVRDRLVTVIGMIKRGEVLDYGSSLSLIGAVKALDAERAEHAMQVADLEHRIKEWEREYDKLQERCLGVKT